MGKGVLGVVPQKKFWGNRGRLEVLQSKKRPSSRGATGEKKGVVTSVPEKSY